MEYKDCSFPQKSIFLQRGVHQIPQNCSHQRTAPSKLRFLRLGAAARLLLMKPILHFTVTVRKRANDCLILSLRLQGSDAFQKHTFLASLPGGGFHAKQGATATASAMASMPLAALFSAILCQVSKRTVRAFRLAGGNSARASGALLGTASCPAETMAGIPLPTTLCHQLVVYACTGHLQFSTLAPFVSDSFQLL